MADLQVGQDDARHGLRGLSPALGVIHIQRDLGVLRRLIRIIYACASVGHQAHVCLMPRKNWSVTPAIGETNKMLSEEAGTHQ